MIYFTADAHFNHSHIIDLCGRPFADVEQMNQTLIQNWNERITDRDEVYILGDLVFKGTGSEANEIIGKLKGRKFLIKGNHDKFVNDKSFMISHFKWIKDYYVLHYAKMKFVLFHYPLFEWDGYFRGAIHLYGHIHNSIDNVVQAERLALLGKKAINVGMDVNDYSPISISSIIDMVK